VRWQRQIGASSFADARTVEQTPDGGYILAGSAGVIGRSSVLVVKLNASGGIQWQQTYGTGYDDTANSVQQVSDGGYVIAGQDSSQIAGQTRGDALLLKLTSAGTIQWQDRYDVGYRCYDNGYSETCLYLGSTADSVRQTADGGYAIAGTIQFLFGNGVETASWLAATDSSGKVSWQNDYYAVNARSGSPYPSSFSAVTQASDGGFVAVGSTDEYNNSDNVWLIKTDASGNVASCTEAHPATSTAFGAGLTPSASSLPVASPGAAGTGVGGAATSATLTAHKDC
jgi:hypothetical protein